MYRSVWSRRRRRRVTSPSAAATIERRPLGTPKAHGPRPTPRSAARSPSLTEAHAGEKAPVAVRHLRSRSRFRSPDGHREAGAGSVRLSVVHCPHPLRILIHLAFGCHERRARRRRGPRVPRNRRRSAAQHPPARAVVEPRRPQRRLGDGSTPHFVGRGPAQSAGRASRSRLHGPQLQRLQPRRPDAHARAGGAQRERRPRRGYPLLQPPGARH